MLLVLHLGMDGRDDLANVDTGCRVLGLSKVTPHACLESGLGTAWGQTWMSTGKAQLQGLLGKPIQEPGCTHDRGGCCLQPWHSGLHGEKCMVGLIGCKLAFLSSLYFTPLLCFWLLLVLVFTRKWSVPTFEYRFKSCWTGGLFTVYKAFFSPLDHRLIPGRGVRESRVVLTCWGKPAVMLETEVWELPGFWLELPSLPHVFPCADVQRRIRERTVALLEAEVVCQRKFRCHEKV